MGRDVVIDTNILVQADDEHSPRHQTSFTFLECMKTNTTRMFVDEGFIFGDEASNSSKIGFEYNKHLPVGSYGFGFLLEIISQGRLRSVSRIPPVNINRAIGRLPIKKADRNFVRVAFNTYEKVLVTHDYEDFIVRIREQIERKFGIEVIDANEFQCFK